MRAEEHVHPVVALQLLLEVVDQGRVDVLRGNRSGDERGSGDGDERAAFHLLLFVVLGADSAGRGGESEVFGPPTQRVMEDYRGLLRRPARAVTFPPSPGARGHGELTVVEVLLPVLGQLGRSLLDGPPADPEPCCS
jgi:hypothetical protein